MSSIMGGAQQWYCVYKVSEEMHCSSPDGELQPIGEPVIVSANSAVEAADMVHEAYGAIQVNCTRN